MNNSLTFLSTLLTGVCLEYLSSEIQVVSVRSRVSLNLVEDSLKLPGGAKLNLRQSQKLYGSDVV